MVREIGENKSEQKVIDDIANYGWHCVNIHPEGENVGYAFTIGLFKNYGHPELIIFGLSAKVAHQILSVAANTAKSGAPLNLAQPTDALIDDYECLFIKVPFSEYREHVGYCRWYYQGNDFPLYQIVWPSRDGLYPWHEKASPGFKAAQPVIADVACNT